MTNDELNGWYHEKIKGKCAHRNAKLEKNTLSHCSDDHCDHLAWVCWDCETSGYCDGKREDLEIIPDYLSDPAVILGIIKEHGRSIMFQRLQPEPGADYEEMVFVGGEWFDIIDLERAVMLALKAKHESK